MDESSDSLMDALDLRLPNIPDQYASLASMTPLLAVNPKAFIQNVNMWNQETVSSTSNALRSSFLSPRNHYESTGTSHDEHQPLGSDDARPEPLRRKSHAKSRRGCYTCKKRRIKVHLTPIHKTEDLRYHSVQRIIQYALNALDVALNVNGQSFILAKQEKLRRKARRQSLSR
jgi:hypothetical protein